MTDEDDREFAIGPGDELKQRFGLTAENWRPRPMRAEVVPPVLRDLIPLAERWGVTCDVTRHDVAAKATDAELSEFSERLKGRHDQIVDWLHSGGDELSDERAAFRAMLVLEMEECKGRGIPGLLAWCIRKYREEPSEERRQRLKAAYDQMAKYGFRHLVSDLAEARTLLGLGG